MTPFTFSVFIVLVVQGWTIRGKFVTSYCKNRRRRKIVKNLRCGSLGFVLLRSVALFSPAHSTTQRRWTWTGDLKCREVKSGFYRNWSMKTGSSGTLIGWESGQTTFVPLWDWMEGAWLRTQCTRTAARGKLLDSSRHTRQPSVHRSVHWEKEQKNGDLHVYNVLLLPTKVIFHLPVKSDKFTLI